MKVGHANIGVFDFLDVRVPSGKAAVRIVTGQIQLYHLLLTPEHGIGE